MRNITNEVTMLDLHNLGDKLKCFICKNYLSYFPISLCSNNQSICGRCTIPDGLICFEDEAFEAICQLSKFPCRYHSEGCYEELLPENVPEHEENCPYKIVSCIISKPAACNWKGCLKTLLHHTQSEHSDVILDNGEFQIDMTVSEEKYNLLEYQDKLFILKRSFDSETMTLQCCVYNHEDERNVESCPVQIRVKNGTKTVSVDFRTTGFDKITLTELCVQYVFGKDVSDKSIQTIINIGTKRTREDERQNEKETHNSEILSLLKCCRCVKFAVPPIYHCIKSTSVLCRRCKIQHIFTCSECHPVEDHLLRYTILDKIAILVKYPCIYQKNGCTYTFDYQQIRKHEANCKYANAKCPLKDNNSCNWNGLDTDLEDHIMSHHGDIISNSSEKMFELDPNCSTAKQSVLRYSNRLFRLTYLKDEQSYDYKWCVELIGSRQETFMYEIDFVPKQNSQRRLLIRQPCLRVYKAINDMDLCKLNLEQISSFYNEGAVRFKVHIYNS